jgi:hypothetical protein
MIARFAGDEIAQLGATMNFISPLSSPASYLPDRRQ